MHFMFLGCIDSQHGRTDKGNSAMYGNTNHIHRKSKEEDITVLLKLVDKGMEKCKIPKRKRIIENHHCYGKKKTNNKMRMDFIPWHLSHVCHMRMHSSLSINSIFFYQNRSQIFIRKRQLQLAVSSSLTKAKKNKIK